MKEIYQLKNWKVPGQDRILAKLIKLGGEKIHEAIHILCKRIWDEERLPDKWNKAIIIPLYKKRDKILCNNYRGIALLNTTYQVFSKILLGRLKPTAEECFYRGLPV